MHFTFFSLLFITTTLFSYSPSFAMIGGEDVSLDSTNSPQSAIAKYSMTGGEYKAKAHEEKKRKKPNKRHTRGDAKEIIERSVQVFAPETPTSDLHQLKRTAGEPMSTPEKIRRSPSTTFQHQSEPCVTLREYVLSELDKIQSLLNEAGEEESQPNDS